MLKKFILSESLVKEVTSAIKIFWCQMVQKAMLKFNELSLAKFIV